MKKIVFILVCISTLNFAHAQSTEISSNYDKIGKFNRGVAIVYKGGLVGAINTSGKEVIKPEYDKITAFGADGLAYCYKRDRVGLISRDGKLIIPNEYDYIGHFKDGYATIRKDKLTGIVDRNGNIVVEIKYDKLKIEQGGIFKAVNPDGSEVLVKKN
jgi:hypothetical protein